MKTGHFVEGLSNEARFLTALKDIDRRGAPEANWLLVEGDPGYGKSNLLMRHAIRNRAFPWSAPRPTGRPNGR